MIFTQTDRTMLKIVHENLGTVLLAVGWRTDTKSLHQRYHELDSKLDRLDLEIPHSINTKLVAVEDKLADLYSIVGKIEVAQRGLDAALNGFADGVGAEIREAKQQLMLLISILHEAKPKRRAKKRL